jgi:hypothetical protein
MAKKTKKQANPKQEIIASAMNMGIGEIIRIHPRFINSGQFIADHINHDVMGQMFDQLYTYAVHKKMPKDEIGQYITKGLASYIASGQAFEDKGRERILSSSLEQKASSGYFRGMSARRELAGDKYLDRVIGTWNKIYSTAKAGGKEVPEKIARPMEYLAGLGFAIPAIEFLEENGLLKRTEYLEMKNNIKKGAYESHSEATQGLREYSQYQKAAVVIGIIGVALLLASGTSSTGAIIGISAGKNIFFGFIGAVSFIASLIMLIKKR